MVNHVQQQYDHLAPIYDQRWQFYIQNTLQFLVQWAHIQPHEKVLDLACGTGEFAMLWHDHCPAHSMLIGVDFSEQMLAIAREKCAGLPNIQFCCAAATQLPRNLPQFDVVVCANAFHYFEPPLQVLAEIGQVLQPAGRVVILDWCRDFWLCRLCDWWLSWRDPAHQRCYTEAELHQLLHQAGYHIGRSRRVRFGWLWGLMIVEATH